MGGRDQLLGIGPIAGLEAGAKVKAPLKLPNVTSPSPSLREPFHSAFAVETTPMDLSSLF
jgi:hypothetical protein